MVFVLAFLRIIVRTSYVLLHVFNLLFAGIWKAHSQLCLARFLFHLRMAVSGKDHLAFAHDVDGAKGFELVELYFVSAYETIHYTSYVSYIHLIQFCSCHVASLVFPVFPSFSSQRPSVQFSFFLRRPQGGCEVVTITFNAVISVAWINGDLVFHFLGDCLEGF